MKNPKNTKRALIASVLVTILCISMLVGSTFAWFTDSVTSGNNIIQSGNLDMALSYKPYGADNTTWTPVDEDTPIFGKDAKYEPGYTNAIWFKVDNVGSLAFRYNLMLNVAKEIAGKNQAGKDFNLSDYLEVKYLTTTSTDMETNFYTTRESLDSFAWGAAANSGITEFKNEVAMINNGVAFPAEEGKEAVPSYVLVVVQMPTTVGNEANHNGEDLPEIKFSLTALATQLTYEEDSFGSDYDANATYPVLVGSADELNDALGNAQPGSLIRLEDNVDYGTIEVGNELDGVTIEGAEDANVKINILGTAELNDVTFTDFDVTYVDSSSAYVDGGAINIDAGAVVKNLTIENSVFNGSGGRSSVIGISEPSAEITMDNCVVNGPKYLTYSSAPISKLTIENCEINNVDSWLVLMNAGDAVGAQLTIDNNTFTDCTGGIAKYLGSSQPEGAFTVFTNNTLTDCTGHDGSDAKWFTIPGATSTITVADNTLDGTDWTPGTAQGLGK